MNFYFRLFFCPLFLPIFSSIEFPKMYPSILQSPLGNVLGREKFYRKETGSTLINPAFPKLTNHEILFFFPPPIINHIPFSTLAGGIAHSSLFHSILEYHPYLKYFLSAFSPEISQWPYIFYTKVTI